MIRNYLSLIKFNHTVFALPFAIIGFFLATQYAGHRFSLVKLGLVLLCMVLARSAAMSFNRYADRRIDAKNPRTATREIPAGIMRADTVLWLVIGNSVLFIVTAYFINPLCFALSPVALTVILAYSYAKRFTSFTHLILGIGLSLAPIGAYLAVSGTFDSWIPIFFSFAIIGWVGGFDIIYALQDEDFDKKERLHSIPASLGKQNALYVSIGLHALTAFAIILAGVMASFGVFYWIGTALFLGSLIYQHTLVKPLDLKRVNLAFFTMNGFASIIFATFMLLDLYIIID